MNMLITFIVVIVLATIKIHIENEKAAKHQKRQKIEEESKKNRKEFLENLNRFF